MYSPYLKQYEPLKMECQHFIECIRTGDQPESSGYDGLRVVQILEAATESLRKEGAKVEIRDLLTDNTVKLTEPAYTSLLEMYDS
jgi:predicted dehydrogenase